MCILQPCVDPTEVGVWWRDDTKWCLYGQTHATSIRNAVHNGLQTIDLGSITSTVHPRGARYIADLSRMEQVAFSTGQRRPIKIIEGPPTSPSQNTSDPSGVSLPSRRPRGTAPGRVHYRDATGQLVQYDQDIADALLAVVGASQRSFVLEHKESPRPLYFDFETMEQRFVESSTDWGEPVLSSDPPRKVIVDVAWDPETMCKLVKRAERTLRRKILVMTVQRFRSEERLNATLPGIAHPRTIVGKKTIRQSFPGERSFEEFVDALEDKLSACPKGIESFIKFTVSGSGGEDSRVQMAFKPVERRKVGHGSKRMAFWRNMAAPMAAAHAAVFCGTAVLHIMAYLVILPDALGAKEKPVGCGEEAEVVISRPDHYLSLAELSVR